MHLEKRILVTGGAGFLGSHLCERLLANGAVAICVDNFFTGARRNIEHLLDHKHFEVIRHDVTFPLYVEVGEIYNLACPASPIHYQHDPVQTTKTSVHGAINMLGLAKRLRIICRPRRQKSMVTQMFTHSPKGIGDTSTRLARAPAMMKESGAPKRYSSITGGNIICRSRSRGSSIPMGRACTPTMGGWSRTIVQALLGRDITVYGDGLQTRSFSYVDDLVDGLVRLMNTPHEITGPVNIGNPSRPGSDRQGD